jgi:hypothetical protein
MQFQEKISQLANFGEEKNALSQDGLSAPGSHCLLAALPVCPPQGYSGLCLTQPGLLATKGACWPSRRVP